MRFHFFLAFVVLVAEFDKAFSFHLTLTKTVQLQKQHSSTRFCRSSVRKQIYSTNSWPYLLTRQRQIMIKANADPSMEIDKEASNALKEDDIEHGTGDDNITAPLIECSEVPSTIIKSKDSNLNETIIELSENSESLVKAASYKELLLFISTTIIIWLSEPLLSLVDTTIVGKFAYNSKLAFGYDSLKGVVPETIQLAALGPATMLCDNAFYVTYFLAMATTNQLAIASAKSDNALQVKTTSHALGVAFTIGLIISVIIFSFGDSLLQFIIGSGGAMVNGVDLTKPIIAFSWDYTKIRGLLAPFTVMGMIAQAVCLATLDTRTPALAVLAASILNVSGDVFLVAKVGMGLRGAAIATAGAGAVSSYILVQEAKKKVEQWKSSLSSEHNRSFISLPDLKSFVFLAKLAGPIFFVIVGKLVCYSAMTLKTSDFWNVLTCHA
jgi:Na+-driven multidrug efflux pump